MSRDERGKPTLRALSALPWLAAPYRATQVVPAEEALFGTRSEHWRASLRSRLADRVLDLSRYGEFDTTLGDSKAARLWSKIGDKPEFSRVLREAYRRLRETATSKSEHTTALDLEEHIEGWNDVNA